MALDASLRLVPNNGAFEIKWRERTIVCFYVLRLPTNESESIVRINIGLNAAPETLAIDKDLLTEMTWLVS